MPSRESFQETLTSFIQISNLVNYSTSLHPKNIQIPGVPKIFGLFQYFTILAFFVNNEIVNILGPKSKYIFVVSTHYSKSQVFVEKFNFDKTPTIFTSFSSKIFLTIFLVKSKLSTAKKPKTTTFSRVFHPKKSTIFSGNKS